MSDFSSLVNAIQQNNKIKQSRKATVIDILNKNGIYTMMDLVTNYIPSKGLTANEIRQLNNIRNDAKAVFGLLNTALKNLHDALGRFTSRHEQSRIWNLLVQNNILSERQLFATSDEKLNSIYGIGPKSMEVLRKVKERFVRTHSRTGVSGYPAPAVSQPALMPLTVY